MLVTILYLIIYYLLVQLKYNLIQQYTDVFIFWPDVVYKIGSTLLLCTILFAECYFSRNKKIVVCVISVVCSILFSYIIFRTYPAEIYPSLYLVSAKVVQLIYGLKQKMSVSAK